MLTGILLFMLSFYSVSAFPEGRCYVHSCNASPYNMQWTSVTKDKSNNLVACLSISSKSCTDTSSYGCCTKFSSYLEKFVVSSNPKCRYAIAEVTINGNHKGGGIYFDIYNINMGEIRVTNLKMQGSRVPGTLVCFLSNHRAIPCPTFVMMLMVGASLHSSTQMVTHVVQLAL